MAPFHKFCFLGLTCLLISQQSLSYDIIPELKFSEMVERIPLANHFANLTIYHPVFEGIAKQTLPLEKFIVLTQQDHLYLDNFFHAFQTMANRESNPDRKAYLQYVADEKEDYIPYWDAYYKKFNFTKPVHLVPVMLHYAVTERSTAKHDDIGVALATVAPCYIIWAKMGQHIRPIADLDNNPNHLYKEFVLGNSRGMDQKFLAQVNDYYSALGNDTRTKQLMLDAYTRSVHHEFSFLEFVNSHKNAQREAIPAPNFTDLVESFGDSDYVKDVINHKLYEEIGNGTLPLDVYAVLIQQSRLFLNAFYAAFAFMEKKETDPGRKALLRQDPSEALKFHQGQFDKYNFGPAPFADGYTRAFMEYIMNIAEHKSVAEGLAAVYPAYSLWSRMGEHISQIANRTANHPYQDFIRHLGTGDSMGMIKMRSLINGYFQRLGDDLETKHEMFRIVEQSTMYEIMFANGVYKMGKFQ